METTPVQDALTLFRIRLTIHVVYAGLIRELLHCGATRLLFGNTFELLLEVLDGLRPARADAVTELDEVVRPLRNAVRGLRHGGGAATDYVPDRGAVVLFAFALGQVRVARRKLTELLKRKMAASDDLTRLARGDAGDLLHLARRPSPANDSALGALVRKLIAGLEQQTRKVRELLAAPPSSEEDERKREQEFCLFTRESYLLLHLLALADPARLTPSRIDEVDQLHEKAGRRMRKGFMKTAIDDRRASLAKYFPPPFDDLRAYLWQSLQQVSVRPGTVAPPAEVGSAPAPTAVGCD